MVNRNGGKTTVLLVILIIMSLGLAGGVFYLFQQEQSSNRLLQDELEEIKARYTIAESKAKEAESSIKQLDLQLQDSKSKVDTLTEEIKQEQEAKKSAQEELEKVKADLTTQKSLRVKLEGELNLAQKALKKAQAQLTELEGKKDLLESKVGNLEQKTQEEGSDVELGTIVVAPDAQAPALTLASPVTKKSAAETKRRPSTSTSEGKVLVINREYNFAVINLGSKDGVAIGDVFYVYHNSKYIGDITLEKIHDSMAAAGFASSAMKNKIAEGDRVVKKKTR
jgi:peptidoglycan hydrolase CwlO-like protein